MKLLDANLWVAQAFSAHPNHGLVRRRLNELKRDQDRILPCYAASSSATDHHHSRCANLWGSTFNQFRRVAMVFRPNSNTASHFSS